MTEEIINILHEGQYTCVIKNSSGIHTFTNRGVADLYDLYTDNPEFLAGASVADKAVGKAAASLMILGGVASVYTDVISSPALSMLRKANVEIRFATEPIRVRIPDGQLSGGFRIIGEEPMDARDGNRS